MPQSAQTSEDIIALTGFEPADPGLTQAGRAALLRRFSTLAVQGAPTVGGLGVVRHARTADEAAVEVALKTPRHRPGCTVDEIRRDDATLVEEYNVLCQVRNLRFFPTVFGRARTAEGDPAILMEWVRGRSLDEYRSGRWPEGCPGTTVAAIGEAALRALDSTRALSATFVHRDLAPKNVIIRTDRTPLALQEERGDFDVCLIDLGSAELVSRDLTFTQRAGLARGGQPPYAAPEMLASGLERIGSRSSQKVDVYATASILYELYAARHPYKAVLDRERDAHGQDADFGRAKLAPCQPLVPRCPADRSLCDLIRTCLAPRQADRPSVEQFLAALRRWRATGQTGAAGTPSQAAAVPQGTWSQVVWAPAQPTASQASTQPEARIPMEQIRRARRSRARKRMLSLVVIAIALVAALLAFAVLATQ